MPPVICHAPKASSTKAIDESTAGAVRGSDPLYVAYRSKIFCKYGLLIFNPRIDFQGAIILISRIKERRFSNDRIDVSSDSINGSRETSHIDSARCIIDSHSAAASGPRDDVIESSVFFRERLANVTCEPSRNL